MISDQPTPPWVLFADAHPQIGQLITIEWKAPYEGEVDCEWAGPDAIDWTHEVVPEKWRPLSDPTRTGRFRNAHARVVDEKMRADPAYAPYCLRPRCRRMTRVSPTRAECRCGSYHQIPTEEE